jgi:hypothetical protein
MLTFDDPTWCKAISATIGTGSNKTTSIRRKRLAPRNSQANAGQRRLQKVLHHLWTRSRMVWKLCDADLHGADAANQEAKCKAKLKPAIFALCNAAAA